MFSNCCISFKGPVVISNITILNGINMVVVTSGVYYPLKVDIKDKYNNLCEMENKDFFKVHIKQVCKIILNLSPPLSTFIILLWLTPGEFTRLCGRLGGENVKEKIA